MAEIRIVLHSDLCSASGSAAGNAIDTDVALDSQGIPYIPARRIKGCLRQSAEDLRDWGCPQASQEAIDRLFGNAEGQAGALTVKNAVLPDLPEIQAAVRKAGKEPVLAMAASPSRIPDLFTYVRGSTAMKDGKAQDGTLRFTRVVDHYSRLNPDRETAFICPVTLADAGCEELLILCCKATRHIGSSRNRGLGEVAFEYLPGSTATEKTVPACSASGERCRVEYRFILQEPVVLPGLEDRISEISSRAVIGCMTEEWLKQNSAEDPVFRRLFLSGETVWEALTPVAGGKRSLPAPRMLARLKGTGAQPVNLLLDRPEEEKKAKIKPLEGCFAVFREDGFDLLSVSVSSMYHHSTEKPDRQGTLYVEESLDAACIYGGVVTVPGDLVEDVLALLRGADFRLGRSRSAQYGACVLLEEPVVRPIREDHVQTEPGETVYAVLLSDLILYTDGLCTPDAASVRRAVAEAAGLENRIPENEDAADSCAYRELGGYQMMWQMRKNVLTAVRAGSYYRFVSPGGEIRREVRLGEFPQEGMGLIRLMPESEIKRMTMLKEVPADCPPETLTASEKMMNALLVASAEEAMKRRCLNYVEKNRGMRNRIQVGRLRLMLEEAKDLTDLVMRAQSIKTDEKRKNTLGLLRDLYMPEIVVNGAARKDGDAPMPPVKPEISAMLDGEDEMTVLLMSHPEAKKRVLGQWKELLSGILTLVYYQERKEEN